MKPSAKVLSGDVAERYAIEGEIGRGGTAVVYRARDRVRGIDVAMKLMREDTMGSLSIERFLLEIRQTAKLPHPHIVPVLDSGEFDGRPYFVLPFMDGGTLRDRLRKEKQLPYDEVITLGVTVARALEFAHAHGVIHRDVKPENILYNNGQPCLADFGTARAMERAVNDPTTSTGVVRGTAAYMSPEQASGEREYDGRTDIYSLACVLYEAIAGIQPFVGPSAQAVISQRLTHPPRPVSVYRPSVPTELEQVLVKATAMAPADRYPNAGALAGALEGVIPTLTQSRPTPVAVRVRTTRARKALVAGVIALATAGSLWVADQSGVQVPFISRPLTGDTTLVAVMPMRSEGTIIESAGQELLAEGLGEWSGVSAVEPFAINDAVKQRGNADTPSLAMAALSISQIARIASNLGAGRFIVPEFRKEGGKRVIHAALYDVRGGKDLYNASVPIPEDTLAWAGAYAALVDALMLRGARDERPRERTLETRNLPSFQAFLQAREALAEWDLERADSLFSASVAFDTTPARSHLWLAQVRNWRQLPIEHWSTSASRAAAESADLTPRERLQASALAALGRGDFDMACKQYGDLTAASPTDFVGWFGLGDCHRLDRLVIADSSSRTKWRYRRSYHQAIIAYQNAFELLPSAYRGVQARAFEPLRQLLYTGRRLRRGNVAGGPPDGFLAQPELVADTIVFLPHPRAIVLSGALTNDPQAEQRAWQRGRKVFSEIIKKWATAFPHSPSVKEGVAIALEMLGDAAAADSFKAARRITQDPRMQLRLAVQEAVVRMKFAVAQHPESLSFAVSLADSILRVASVSNPSDAEMLARLSTLLGRCGESARLARLVPNEYSRVNALTPSMAEEARVAFTLAVAGCPDRANIPRLYEPLRRNGASEQEAKNIELDLTAATIGLRFPRDSALSQKLADGTGYYVAVAESFILSGDPEKAKQKLDSGIKARQNYDDLAMDAVVREARLWRALGDSALARRLIDKALADVRYSNPLTPDQFFVNQLRLGAIGAALELKAQLEVPSSREYDVWQGALRSMWSRADSEIRVRIARQKQK